MCLVPCGKGGVEHRIGTRHHARDATDRRSRHHGCGTRRATSSCPRCSHLVTIMPFLVIFLIHHRHSPEHTEQHTSDTYCRPKTHARTATLVQRVVRVNGIIRGLFFAFIISERCRQGKYGCRCIVKRAHTLLRRVPPHTAAELKEQGRRHGKTVQDLV